METAQSFVEQFLELARFEAAGDFVHRTARGGFIGNSAGPIARLAAFHAAVKKRRKSPCAHEVKRQDSNNKYVKPFFDHIRDNTPDVLQALSLSSIYTCCFPAKYSTVGTKVN
jgi:hypothetical protein